MESRIVAGEVNLVAIGGSASTHHNTLTGRLVAGEPAAGWRCERCQATFTTLIAAIAHVEVRHPNRERGRHALSPHT